MQLIIPPLHGIPGQGQVPEVTQPEGFQIRPQQSRCQRGNRIKPRTNAQLHPFLGDPAAMLGNGFHFDQWKFWINLLEIRVRPCRPAGRPVRVSSGGRTWKGPRQGGGQPVLRGLVRQTVAGGLCQALFSQRTATLGSAHPPHDVLSCPRFRMPFGRSVNRWAADAPFFYLLFNPNGAQLFSDLSNLLP